MWPSDPEELEVRQARLAAAEPPPWAPPSGALLAGGAWVCFARGCSGPGTRGETAWSAAVLLRDGVLVDEQVLAGAAGSAYVPGMLALRVGALLEEVTRALGTVADVMLVDGTGRDHPRGAGLALHLGAELDLPTVGVTHRPLVAQGDWPADARGARTPLRIGSSVVGCWLRTRAGTRPLAVHPGWRVDVDVAADVVLRCSRTRTPEPLRLARHAARTARARSQPS
jgi:deoxyribonuclease V